MVEYSNEYRIALFKCKLPKSNPKGPDLSASFTIDGKDYRASLWVVTDKETGQPKKDRNNFNFYTGPIELEQQPDQQAPPPPQYDEPQGDAGVPF